MARALALMVAGVAVGSAAAYAFLLVTRAERTGLATVPAPHSHTAQTDPQPFGSLELAELSSAFQAWTESDPEAAFAALSALGSARQQRDVALAMLDVLGYGAAALERVFAAAPLLDDLGFRTDALARWAERDPRSAWQYVTAQPPSARTLLEQALAVAWTRSDPAAALAHAESIPDPATRATWLAEVFAEWASLDPPAFLRYAMTLDSPALPSAAAALERLAASNTEAVLALAEQLPDAERRRVRLAAVAAMAVNDPTAAMAKIAGFAGSRDERDALVRTIARTYAAADIDNALAWARAQRSSSTVAMRGVLGTLAERDFERAAALVIAEVGAGRPFAAGSALGSVTAQVGSRRMRELAETLAAFDNTAASAVLSDVLTDWELEYPEDALAWALERGGVAELRAAVGYRGTLDHAFAQLDRVPEARRALLIGATAIAHSFNDLPESLRALERFRDSPYYDEAAPIVLGRAASHDPTFVAGALATASAAVIAEVAPHTARNWAQRQPRDAVQWALTIADAGVRARAVGAAIAEWAARNPRAAGEWAGRLPRGPLRDHALATTIVNATANGLAYDARLLTELSSDEARDRALGAAATLPQRWRMQRAAVAEAAPAVAAYDDVLVGTLPWSPQ